MAAFIGGVRIWSLGRLRLSRSADFVSMRRRLGTLGRLGGGGLRKARWEGGGDRVLSNDMVVVGAEAEGSAEDEMAAGIIGRGE